MDIAHHPTAKMEGKARVAKDIKWVETSAVNRFLMQSFVVKLWLRARWLVGL